MNKPIFKLENLQNPSRPKKRRKLLGRGPASGHGKTCCRGHKGAGSRSGWKMRAGSEGGNVPLYRKLPTRGFSNAQFARKYDAINLGQIDKIYEDGETVNLETLRDKGFLQGASYGIKILGEGKITKKLNFEVEALSKTAEKKLAKAGIKSAAEE